MSTDERVRGVEPPPARPFRNYRLLGAALRGVAVEDVVWASPYRGSSHEE